MQLSYSLEKEGILGVCLSTLQDFRAFSCRVLGQSHLQPPLSCFALLIRIQSPLHFHLSNSPSPKSFSSLPSLTLKLAAQLPPGNSCHISGVLVCLLCERWGFSPLLLKNNTLHRVQLWLLQATVLSSTAVNPPAILGRGQNRSFYSLEEQHGPQSGFPGPLLWTDKSGEIWNR